MNLSKITIVLILSLALSACSLNDIRANTHKSDVPVSEVSVEEVEEMMQGVMDLPEEINLDMIFYSQAPFGNWALPYQEFCEEASLLLAYYYLMGKEVDIDTFHNDLLKMMRWENERFGQYFHTTMQEMAEIAVDYLGIKNYEIIDNPTIDDIKENVAMGYPVLAPFSGRALGNPFFKGTKPFYHVLVIRGYDDNEFITNDVGTRHGENYAYSYDAIMGAMHEVVPEVFFNTAAIDKGPKRILVLKPNSSGAGVGK